MLREDFGLEVVGRMVVLAFGGLETVEITRGFRYSAGGVEAVADSALVGLSACECNGLGVDFLRKAGIVFAVDYAEGTAAFLRTVPEEGMTLAFGDPPPGRIGLDSAFIEVSLAAGGRFRTVTGLLDTGATATVMRRGLVGPAPIYSPDRMAVRVGNEHLGAVTINVGLFDQDGLPAIILGNDIMRAWADRWYFSFAQAGGTVIVVPRSGESSDAEVPAIATRAR